MLKKINPSHILESGFYFKSESAHLQPASIREHHKKRGTANNDHIKTFELDYLYISTTYWKELLLLTVIISILMQFLIAKCMQVYKEKVKKISTYSKLIEFI